MSAPTLDNFFSDYGYTQTYVRAYTCTYMLVYLNACVHVCNQMCLFAGSVYMVSRLNTALKTNKGTSSWEKLILLSAVIIFLKFLFFVYIWNPAKFYPFHINMFINNVIVMVWFMQPFLGETASQLTSLGSDSCKPSTLLHCSLSHRCLSCDMVYLLRLGSLQFVSLCILLSCFLWWFLFPVK